MNNPITSCFDYIDHDKYPDACIAIITSTLPHFNVIVPWFTKKRFLTPLDWTLFEHAPTFRLCPRISIRRGTSFEQTKHILSLVPQLRQFTLDKNHEAMGGITDLLLQKPMLDSVEFNDNPHLPAADYVKLFDHCSLSVRKSAVAQLSYRCFNSGFNQMPDRVFGRQAYEAGIAERLRRFCERDANKTNESAKTFFRQMEGLLYAIPMMTFSDVEFFIDYIRWGLRPDCAGKAYPAVSCDINVMALINAIQLARENLPRAEGLAKYHPEMIQEVYRHCFPVDYGIPPAKTKEQKDKEKREGGGGLYGILKMMEQGRRRHKLDEAGADGSTGGGSSSSPPRDDGVDESDDLLVVDNDDDDDEADQDDDDEMDLVEKANKKNRVDVARLEGVRRLRALQALYSLAGEYDAPILISNPTILEYFDLDELCYHAERIEGKRRRECVEWTMSLVGLIVRARVQLSAENPSFLDRLTPSPEFEKKNNSTNNNNNNNNNNNHNNHNNGDGDDSSSSSSSAAAAPPPGYGSIISDTVANLIVRTLNDSELNVNTFKYLVGMIDDLVLAAMHSSNAQHAAGSRPRDPCDLRRKRYTNLILPLERCNLIPALLHVIERQLPLPPGGGGGLDRGAAHDHRLAQQRTLEVFSKGMVSIVLVRLMRLHLYFDRNDEGRTKWETGKQAPLLPVRTFSDDEDDDDSDFVRESPKSKIIYKLRAIRHIQDGYCSFVKGPPMLTLDNDAAVVRNAANPNLADNWSPDPSETQHERSERLAFFRSQFDAFPGAAALVATQTSKQFASTVAHLTNHVMRPLPQEFNHLCHFLDPDSVAPIAPAVVPSLLIDNTLQRIENFPDAREMFFREVARRRIVPVACRHRGDSDNDDDKADVLELAQKNQLQGEEEEQKKEKKPKKFKLCFQANLADSEVDDEDEEEEEDDEEDEEELEEEEEDDDEADEAALVVRAIDRKAGEDDDDKGIPSLDDIMSGAYKKKRQQQQQATKASARAAVRRQRDDKGDENAVSDYGVTKNKKGNASTSSSSRKPAKRPNDDHTTKDRSSSKQRKATAKSTARDAKTQKSSGAKTKKASASSKKSKQNKTKKAAKKETTSGAKKKTKKENVKAKATATVSTKKKKPVTKTKSKKQK